MSRALHFLISILSKIASPIFRETPRSARPKASSSPERLFRSGSGQTIVVVALLAPILIAMTGFAVDYGLSVRARRDEQNAADSAALAGAGVLIKGGTVSQARTAAVSWAQKNGYSSSETTVNIPPATGSHRGDSNYVEVKITRPQDTTFMRAVRVNDVATAARGVAGFKNTPKNYAMVVLNPTACSSYNQSSGNALTINNGGLMVNSSCQPSGRQGGGSGATAQFIDYYSPGSWQQSNNATASPTPSPAPARIADPLASLTRPVAGTASVDSGGTATNPRLKQVNSATTLHPGTYYGGLKITGSGAVTFQAGTYIFAGGGLDYSGSSALTGNGVTFYNTFDSQHTSGAGACGSFQIQGSGNLSFTAPGSGAYKDMLFWQDPACTNQMKYGGTTYLTNGIIYLPTAQLNISGGGSIGAIQVIVDTFSYSGSSSLTITYGNYVQVVAPKLALVE